MQETPIFNQRNRHFWFAPTPPFANNNSFAVMKAK
jgi:hypothetical protein